SSWPVLDQALTATDQGDGHLLLRLSDLYYGEFSLDAFIVIECLDRPSPTDIASYDALGPAFAKASPFFGPAFQYSNLQCAYLGVKATGHAGPITAEGAPPILLVGGTNDPATPYSWAVSLHQQLASSVLLTRSGRDPETGSHRRAASRVRAASVTTSAARRSASLFSRRLSWMSTIAPRWSWVSERKTMTSSTRFRNSGRK